MSIIWLRLVLGTWVCITPRVIKEGATSGVVDALVSANGETIARANAALRVKI